MPNQKYTDLELFIDGKWRGGSEGKTAEIQNPATHEVIGHLPLATIADLNEALSSTERGFEIWRSIAPARRCAILQKTASLIRERAARIAEILTLEQGKPFAEAKGEVFKAAEIVDWGAQEGRRTYGRTVPSEESIRLYTIQEPVGPVAAFSPWNFPAISPTRKLAGALAAGCSVILKASEQVPGAAVEIVRAFVEAGVPDGAINLIFGDPAQISSHLLESQVIRKLTFTGSVPVGKHLAGLAARNMKTSTMELGGHSPVIICDDVDIDEVVTMSVKGKFRNAGQVCTAPTRFLVQESVSDVFVARFCEVAANIRVGDGFDPATEMGPLLNERRIAAMETLVSDAAAKGARVAIGGKRLHNRGSFFSPTVLTDVPLSADVMNTEPFGPIALINRFNTLDSAVAEANRLPFGLAAYAFTKSIKRSAELSRRIDAGMVAVNGMTVSFAETPFGGIKDSGYGREGGVEGIESYTVKRLIVEQSLEA
ncbi:NAD-dependent succinate-semialdehyde dehydrogenase [Bradyrhizobium mercantei]|uniref:NAD-dependent succinate-semialdehyde dehydrogenase n=1 Tax=Bradyrhizobium mercantei TaxID=1904807 RepID=UPI0009756D72|nr:NAD-dependent succinate-semialdehyde dehydrogenase [Bradyrhizobium mercantei]